jgi:hypothetical protein
MVKKNTSIELAVALMLKGMAYMLCILVCAMFLPLLSYRSDICKELTLDEAGSIVYRFHSNWRIYILLCVNVSLENKTRALSISNSIK